MSVAETKAEREGRTPTPVDLLILVFQDALADVQAEGLFDR